MRPLLERWGGEAIYGSHRRSQTIGRKLVAIGTPCIVQAVIPVASIECYSTVAERFVNLFLANRDVANTPEADWEGCIQHHVPAEAVQGVIKLSDPEFYLLTGADQWLDFATPG